MRRLAIAACVVAVGVGIATFVQGRRVGRLDAHWRAVEEFKRYLTSPRSRLGADPDGQAAWPEASLAALVQAGVLHHVDIVFPNVPCEQRGLAAYWMERCLRSTNIVFAYGNPSTLQLEAQGVEPLHLNLWFREAATQDVARLISEIDAAWGSSRAEGRAPTVDAVEAFMGK